MTTNQRTQHPMSTVTPTSTAGPAVEISGLVVEYGSHRVLDGLSLRVERGEIFGILGHNGAGKTTLVESLQGLRPITSGRARVLGLDPARDLATLRRRVGSQLQSSALPERMRVNEAVRLFARLAGDVVDWRELMTTWGLDRLSRKPFRALSGGEQQRLFLALALVGRPELVFLDELTQGLDPLARRATWALVEQVRAQGATVVLVSHHMDEVDALCGRIGLLSAGHLDRVGTPAELMAMHPRGVRVVFSLNGSAPPDMAARLTRQEGVEKVEQRARGARTAYQVRGRAGIGTTVAALLHHHGQAPTDLRIEPAGLEDLLIDLTTERSAS